jgi:hypothetical protein
VSTATLERTEGATIAPAAPLTTSEQDSLIALAASTQKVERRRWNGRFPVGARAWSLGGNVD